MYPVGTNLDKLYPDSRPVTARRLFPRRTGSGPLNVSSPPRSPPEHFMLYCIQAAMI